MSTNTISEFLVALGYDVNHSGQKDFESAIQSATLKAKLLADGLEEVARKVLDSVSSIASNFEQLYFQAQRTNTLASTMHDFGTVMQNWGVSIDKTNSSVESMALKLRQGLIGIQDLHRVGFGKNAITGEIEPQRQYLDLMKNTTSAMLDQNAAFVGMDEQVAQKGKQHGGEVIDAMDKLKSYRSDIGLDYDKAVEDSNKFESAWRTTKIRLGDIGKDIQNGLQNALVEPLRILNTFLLDHATDIGENIDIIMTALMNMTSQWAIDLKKFSEDPDALKGFKSDMHEISVSIAAMALSFHGFVDDLRWLDKEAGKIADILNHLSGGKQNGPGWDEYFGSGVEERRKAEAAEPPSMWRSIKDGARRLLGLPPSGGADAGGGAATGSSAGSLTKLIDEAAAKEGIDSRIMEGIRAGESGHGSNYDKKDDAIESSWGPFQLNRRRGLGVEFEKDTGLDVRNPSTIPAQAAWVAKYIKDHGGTNNQWMGYRGPRDADPKWGESGYAPTPVAPPASTGAATESKDYGNLRLTADAASAGPSASGVIALAHHIQDTEDVSKFHALHDAYHVTANPRSAHNRGLALDVSMNDGNYEASRARTRQYLLGLGLTEGGLSGGDGDFAIEPGTTNHMHVQFNSAAAAQRYADLVAPTPRADKSAADKASPWGAIGPWKPAGAMATSLMGGQTPTLGGASPAGPTTIHAPMETKIIIDGSSGDPTPSAHMVGAGITQKPADLTRNLQGATN